MTSVATYTLGAAVIAEPQFITADPMDIDFIFGDMLVVDGPDDSSTGGYLLATYSSSAEDIALTRILQQALAGISGIRPPLVRPRFQAIPPPQPPRNTDWASIGFTDRDDVDYVGLRYDQTAYEGKGGMWLVRQEKLKYLISFYGPNSDGNGTRTRDGFYIPQNWEYLYYAGFALYEVKHEANMAELVNKAWVQRCDISLTVMREVERLYPVRYFAAAKAVITGTPHAVRSTIGVP